MSYITTGCIVSLPSHSQKQLIVKEVNVSKVTCLYWCEESADKKLQEVKLPKKSLVHVEDANTSRDDVEDLLVGEVLQLRGTHPGRPLFTVLEETAFKQDGKVLVAWFCRDGIYHESTLDLIALTRVSPRPR